MRVSRLRPASPALVLALVAGSAGADVTPIALSGDPAPGLPGLTFARLAQARIIDSGEIAFWARLAGNGITDANDGSLWSDRSGALALSYREDGPAPFDGDIRWGAFPFPAFNQATDLSFTAALIDAADPDNPTNLGIFAEDNGSPLVVAREGFSAPGLPGKNFDGLPVAPFSDAGEVTFNGVKGSAAWSWDGGDPDPVVVTGDPAPIVGAPFVFSFIDNPAQNAAGDRAFRASLIDPAKPKDPRPSLWSVSGGQLNLITWADPTPDAEVYFTDVAIEPVVTGAGDVHFWGSVAGEGVDASNDTAIWIATDLGPFELFREGSAAPGGGLFGQLPRTLASNPAGDMAFAAPLVGPGTDATNNSGLYSRSAAGLLASIAREGEQAPGLPDGVLFAVFGQPSINASGQVAFGAYLRGAAEQGNNYALFLTDDDGNPQPVLRTGDTVDLGGGDERVAVEIAFASGDPGSGYTQMAADGTLVFHLTFEDRTHGLFAGTAGGGCAPDLDNNGVLDLFDFLEFVNLFNAGDAKADCDDNAVFDLFDFLCFVNQFTEGC
jgi:hypothetical protein